VKPTVIAASRQIKEYMPQLLSTVVAIITII